MRLNHYTYQSPVGRFTLESDGEGLTRLAFGEEHLGGSEEPNIVTNTAANQVQEYLAGKRRVFDLALHPQGTQFQCAVWAALQNIPYGETRTYSEVAAAIGAPKSGRAVGNANNRNPIPLIIPCHRVLPASGGVGGYAYGEDVKRFLLDLERKNAR